MKVRIADELSVGVSVAAFIFRVVGPVPIVPVKVSDSELSACTNLKACGLPVSEVKFAIHEKPCGLVISKEYSAAVPARRVIVRIPPSSSSTDG